MPGRRTVLLVHGGLAEDVDATEFWDRPGLVDALAARGWDVIAPDRDTTPVSWSDAATRMAARLDHPVAVIGASNGVSVAVRMALDHPDLVERLVLAWPATAGDPDLDATVPDAGRHLLAGETLRGVQDDELRSLERPVTVLPATAGDRFHRRHTVDRLVALVPAAAVTGDGLPNPMHPEFGAHRNACVEALIAALTS